MSLSLIVGACSALPTSGPSVSNILDEYDDVQDSADGLTSTMPALSFELVDLSQRVVQVLQSQPADTLQSKFGDYRPSPDARIGVGDAVSIVIWEAGSNLFGGASSARGLVGADLAGVEPNTSTQGQIPEQIVPRDGRITVPFTPSRIPVVGRTPVQVQEAIIAALQTRTADPQVIVAITRSGSNAVSVVGEVKAGDRVPLSVQGDRLLDVLAKVGGVSVPVNEASVILTRDTTTVEVPLARILADSRENIFMRGGDIVTVVRRPKAYSALGATGANYNIVFGGDTLSLSEAITKAGGLQDFRADPEGVFLLRYERADLVRAFKPDTKIATGDEPVPTVYAVNMRSVAGMFLAQNFEMRDKDVLFVSNAPLTEMQKLIQLIQGAAQPVATGAGISNAFGGN
ncbi:polysaccharide biosynthesis/export family protein [Zavarzinia compransoris]|uniref:polysaccharide biosynthesis/export family protein n=1 Tax=Zavarzinia compransoris TaxID=1264899 RepID=UPI0014150844|nr:polysaccharide biosynthesis/export family protein [Zavarzinia compransoris]